MDIPLQSSKKVSQDSRLQTALLVSQCQIIQTAHKSGALVLDFTHPDMLSYSNYLYSKHKLP